MVIIARDNTFSFSSSHPVFSGLDDTNSFLFLSQEWHRTCGKGFTEAALKLRMSNIHLYPFKETKSLLEEEKGFVDTRLDLLQRTSSSPRSCLFFYQSYVTTSGRRGNRYLRIGGMLDILRYLDCSHTNIALPRVRHSQ